MSNTTTRALLLAAVASGAMIASASAQESVTLKLAHPLPATHYLWEQGAKAFTDAVTKDTKGAVKFEIYPAGQLGKDYLALLKSGIADVVMLITSYTPEKFPLTSVSELPGLYSTSCEATGKLWQLAKEGGLLNEREYKSNGIRALFVTTLAPYKIMTVSKETSTIDKVAGLKIRANGAAMDKTIRALGGVPVRVTATELYDSLTRGTVDGGFYPYSGLPPYKLEKVMHHAVEGVQLGSGSVLFAMSEKGWNALPKIAKSAMAEASMAAQGQLCDWQDKEEAKIRDKIVAEDGFKVINLSPEEGKLWQDRVQTVGTAWAAELDAAGKKGTEILKAFKEASGLR